MTTSPTDLEIERFLRAADNAAKATEDGQKLATRAFVIKRATALRKRRDALRVNLEAGWTWLEENPDDPTYAESEATLLEWMQRYERINDALNEGLHRWLGTTAHEPRKAA